MIIKLLNIKYDMFKNIRIVIRIVWFDLVWFDIKKDMLNNIRMQPKDFN